MTLEMITNWLRMRRLGKLGIVGIVALIFAGVSAHAAIRAIVEQSAPPVTVAPRPAGYEAEDHFPGAAYLYVADENAAPAKGTTGTAALPDLPLPPEAATLAADTSVQAAAPFSMRFASATDRGRALQCLTAAIYYEAASEPDAGQQAVAQVILNRVRHPAFPATVCGVIYQGSERTTGCQFSYACDGSMARIPSKAYWNRAMRVAAQALNGGVFAPVGMATHYHTYAVTPSWNRSLVMTAAIGAHFFHRWQGYWGTPGAFRQVYRGGEPLPGPHPRAEIHAVTLAAAAAVPPAPRTAPASIQPAYAQSGMPTGGYVPAAAPTALPGDSQILDRWKDSGKPLH
ncbi:cell wall hydrolase [Sphingomonas sp. So64.6b]|uniref:cell wall hydrolase n=1 Tax=Sphingomonas sp. So64.6b TaxID=2997354 RepID=UPI001FCE8F10|nr:cell wall hydrolase [Sphingomonas sp. So64.6b]